MFTLILHWSKPVPIETKYGLRISFEFWKLEDVKTPFSHTRISFTSHSNALHSKSENKKDKKKIRSHMKTLYTQNYYLSKVYVKKYNVFFKKDVEKRKTFELHIILHENTKIRNTRSVPRKGHFPLPLTFTLLIFTIPYTHSIEY